MKLELDKTDYDFVKTIVLRAKAHWELAMTDANKVQSFRDRCRENAKMAGQAAEMLYAAENKTEGSQERERFDELAKPLYDSINRLTIEFTGIKRLLEMRNGQ